MVFVMMDDSGSIAPKTETYQRKEKFYSGLWKKKKNQKQTHTHTCTHMHTRALENRLLWLKYMSKPSYFKNR